MTSQCHTGSRRPWRHTTIILLTLLALAVVNDALTARKIERVDRVVRQIMRCANIPALGLALIGLEDRSQYVKTYGTADPGTGDRANLDTRFCLGEATEAFTAVLLAKLINENENVTWSTPIQDIVGHRVILPDEHMSTSLNVMDILAQRSGLPGMDIMSVAKPFSVRRLIRNLRYVKPTAGFRENFIPNQVLFSLLEEVSHSLGGDSWEKLLKKHILEPLEMNSVMILGDKTAADAANLAYPVIYHDGKPQPLSPVSFKGMEMIKPAASLCLSTTDMAKWIRFMMHGKAANGDQLIDQDVLEETFKGVQARGHGDDPEIVGYRQPEVQVSYARQQNALGWITGHYRGYQFVSQDGSIPGSQALSTILPSRNVAVFTSFTGVGGSKGLAAKVLVNLFSIDVLMRGNPWFDDTNVCGIMDELMDMDTGDRSMDLHRNVMHTSRYIGERSLDDFVGYYRNYAYGDVVIKYNETEDHDLIMEYGQAVYKMAPTNANNTFQLIARGVLWYTTNNYNKVIAVFSEDERDPEQRISTLIVSGFDRNGDVVFSTNPVAPRVANDREVECNHASTRKSISWLSLLIISLAILLR